MRLILQVLLNGVALWLAARIVPGIEWTGDWIYLLLAGLVFGLINLIVKPIVTFFSLPLIVLTLGLFFLVINALMLYLAAYFLDGLTVSGFLAALLGGLVIALFNWAVRAFGA
ncbi:MAG TPA: phage holin family protein [Thermoanaerobaculia bacterium]|nr:phage holin family protein [Thermoanaerobaculia bacterium]